jgi:phosphate starvation-inducible PhoH-like protein
LSPFESIFRKTLKDGFYEYCLKDKKIVPLPIGFMRGETFENTIVLVDECQNLTKREFHMLLSRIGKNCKVILSGDPRQVDIPDSGMEDAMERLRGVRGIDVVEFLEEDIVRSSMCKSIIKAYRD